MYLCFCECEIWISIHALRGEGDIVSAIAGYYGIKFQSTPSVGRATPSSCLSFMALFTFQSTPSVGRATFVSAYRRAAEKFQSTPSVGRATTPEDGTTCRVDDFNPRPPWGGRQRLVLFLAQVPAISIHALRGEGDIFVIAPTVPLIGFQSTPSVGRATGPTNAQGYYKSISIHALRGEGDVIARLFSRQVVISIHALRGEGDKSHAHRIRLYRHFNPRPPWGGRQRGF